MGREKKRKYEFKKDKKWRKIKTYILIVLIAILGVASITAGVKMYFLQKNENKTSNALLKEEEKYGVIINEATLYKNPSTDSEIVTTVVVGEEFNFVTYNSFKDEEENAYYLISYEDSEENINIGYVNALNIEIKDKTNEEQGNSNLQEDSDVQVNPDEINGSTGEESNKEVYTEAGTTDSNPSSEIEKKSGEEKYDKYKATRNGKTIEGKKAKIKNIKMASSSITMKVGESQTLAYEVEPKDLLGDAVIQSSDTSIVSVEDGVITALKEGMATISVQSKDKSVSASCRVVVEGMEVESIELKPAKIRLFLSSEDTQIEGIRATLLPEGAKDKKLTWSSSNSKVVKVNQNGIVEGVGIGTATITVKSSNKKTATAVVEVLPWPVTSVKLNSESITLHLDTSTNKVKAEVLPRDAYDKKLTWTSDNTKVATVDKSGNIKGVGLGTATITAKASSGKTDAIKVKVISVPVTSVKVNKSTVNLARNSTVKVGAVISPSNATNKSVSWSSSNTRVATVDRSGNIRGVGVGTATITVKTTNGKQASVKVNVGESGSCSISSISARNLTVSYKISCSVTSYVSDTQYKVGNGSYTSRGNGWGSVTSKSGSIVFKNSNAGRTVTLRVYYNGNSKNVTKSVKLGNPYCKSGYKYNTSSRRCEKRASISSRVSCSTGKYNSSSKKCVTTSYTCPRGGTKSTTYSTIYCMNRKKTSVFKIKLNNGMYGYKASPTKKTFSPKTSYYCKSGRKVGSGRSAYCVLSYNP